MTPSPDFSTLLSTPLLPAPALPPDLPEISRQALQRLLAEQPLALGVAALLRGEGRVWPEEQELDWAVRHWEAARRAGQAWSADFGECWRQIEFAATALLLEQLSGIDPLGETALPRFALVLRSATRYRELAPLLPWAEQRRPGVTQKGFA